MRTKAKKCYAPKRYSKPEVSTKRVSLKRDFRFEAISVKGVTVEFGEVHVVPARAGFQEKALAFTKPQFDRRGKVQAAHYQVAV